MVKQYLVTILWSDNVEQMQLLCATKQQTGCFLLSMKRWKYLNLTVCSYEIKTTVLNKLMIKQADTEDGSPDDNENQLDPMMKEDDEGLDAAEESPDQSISSAMPSDSGVEGNPPLVQDGMFVFVKYVVIRRGFCTVLYYKM